MRSDSMDHVPPIRAKHLATRPAITVKCPDVVGLSSDAALPRSVLHCVSSQDQKALSMTLSNLAQTALSLLLLDCAVSLASVARAAPA